MLRPFFESLSRYINIISMVHDRPCCICCFGDFLSLTLFVVNKACTQCRTEIQLKSFNCPIYRSLSTNVFLMPGFF